MFVNRNISLSAAITLLFLSSAFGCRNTVRQITQTLDTAVDGNDHTPNALILNMPADNQHGAYQGLAIKPIRTFYSRRKDKLFWTSGAGLPGSTDSVIAFIEKIRYYGLLPGDYHLVEIVQLKNGVQSAENIFRVEALLTDAYITMARHIRFGKTMHASLKTDSSGVALLENPYQCGSLVKNVIGEEPTNPQYRLLKEGLKQFLDCLPPELQRYALSDNVMMPDSIRIKLQTIEVNLERWRSDTWLFNGRYIFINIPAFTLYLVENDSVILESKIIVGKVETPTPTLSSVIECFVTYPYWHVPRKIAIEEYLPVIQRDITFLKRNNFDVLDRQGNILDADTIPWKQFNRNYFPVLLRQRDGEENALGVLKFVFDNPYGVFLHDTNAKRLFNHHVRAFSHGCIRMEKAVELSHYLATGDLRKKSKYVERLLKEKSMHTVELLKPIPIHIRYYTCDFYDNKLRYHHDIYKKDPRLKVLLYDASARK